LSFTSVLLLPPAILLQVHLPDWALWLRPGINAHYASTTFRLYASSPAQPEQALQLDLGTGTLSPLQDSTQHTPAQHHQHTLPSQLQQPSLQQRLVHDPTLPAGERGIVAERLWAPAPDGTAVPLTLLRKAGPNQQPRPLLVEVYGAYGHVLEAEFKPHRMPLLERGWAVALAHVRGGGELGRR
jgi:protease II